jgi:predicted nucleic acid-binding protein
VKTLLRTVPDTNVIVARQNASANSPNREYLERWENDEFELLYTDDTLREYIEKLLEKDVPQEKIIQLIVTIQKLGIHVPIRYYHLAKYPTDPDDIPFLLCAVNGSATHLISYDRHLLDLDALFDFKICKTLDFLFELRLIFAKEQGDK